MAFPPDSFPSGYYQDSNLIEESVCSGIAFLRHIVVVSFKDGTTLEQRQSALQLVDGTVVGGVAMSERGFYLIRVADDGSGAGVCEAAHVLETLPYVEVASPEYKLEYF